MNLLLTESGMRWGGQELRSLLELQFLLEAGHQSWLMCHPDSAIYYHALSAGIPAANLVTMNFRYPWRLDRAIKIVNFCRHNEIDVIAVRGSRDARLCLPSFISGVPIVRFKHIQSPTRSILGYRIGCSRIVATSSEIAEELSAKGISQQRVVVINEGVDLKEFSPGKKPAYLLREFGLAADTPVILNIGMLRADKGQIHFLGAAKEVLEVVPNARFFIVGGKIDGNDVKNQLKEYISNQGLEHSVVLTGYRKDVAALTRLADIVVLSSLAEAQSRIIPQAFATERPVIATNVGGIPELIVHNLTGLLVPPANPSAIGRAILKLLNDRPFSQELASNGYEFAQRNLCFTEMMKQIVGLYTSVLHSTKSNSSGSSMLEKTR